MIGSLRGKLISLHSGVAILEVGGVGYEITLTAQASELVRKSPEQAFVTVFTDLRENGIFLYGFADRAEREVFHLLKKVKGIGAKLSVAILSCLGTKRLLYCIGSGESDALLSVSGVGKKTAQRIIVELRETVEELIGETAQTNAHASSDVIGDRPVLSQEAADALCALDRLGFSQESAKKAIDRVLSARSQAAVGKELKSGEILRLALASLS